MQHVFCDQFRGVPPKLYVEISSIVPSALLEVLGAMKALEGNSHSAVKGGLEALEVLKKSCSTAFLASLDPVSRGCCLGA